jgi:hypothetical protein
VMLNVERFLDLPYFFFQTAGIRSAFFKHGPSLGHPAGGDQPARALRREK